MGIKTALVCPVTGKSNIQVLNYPALLRLCWLLCVYAKSEWFSFAVEEKEKNPGGPVFRGSESGRVVEVGLQEGGTPTSPHSHFLSGILNETSDCIYDT